MVTKVDYFTPNDPLITSDEVKKLENLQQYLKFKGYDCVLTYIPIIHKWTLHLVSYIPTHNQPDQILTCQTCGQSISRRELYMHQKLKHGRVYKRRGKGLFRIQESP